MEIAKHRPIFHNFIKALLIVTLMGLCTPLLAQQSADAEQLGMALEYFQGGKYHEALNIFQRLDKRYKLNPRFRAYIALCYYYDWDYKKAVDYFDKALPDLGGLAPHELSVYYFAAAESYFQLQKYDRALTYYQQALDVSYDRDKGDIYYRIGFCHMLKQEWQAAYDNYSLAEQNYLEFHSSVDLDARLAQATAMKRGCLAAISRDIDHQRSALLRQHPSISDFPDTLSPWSSFTFPIFTSLFQPSKQEIPSLYRFFH